MVGPSSSHTAGAAKIGYVSGNAISFNSTGKIKATITQVVGFNLSYVINSSGTYDKSAGKGSVTVSAY